MKHAPWCLLLLCATTLAQTTKIESALSRLKSPDVSRASVSQELIDAMMFVADPDSKPSRETVSEFAEELTSALAGRKLFSEQIPRLAPHIANLLHRRGPSITRSVSQARQILTVVGVDASKLQLLTRQMINIGEQVRGPDDMPVQPSPLFRRQ